MQFKSTDYVNYGILPDKQARPKQTARFYFTSYFILSQVRCFFIYYFLH